MYRSRRTEREAEWSVLVGDEPALIELTSQLCGANGDKLKKTAFDVACHLLRGEYWEALSIGPVGELLSGTDASPDSMYVLCAPFTLLAAKHADFLRRTALPTFAVLASSAHVPQSGFGRSQPSNAGVLRRW